MAKTKTKAKTAVKKLVAKKRARSSRQIVVVHKGSTKVKVKTTFRNSFMAFIETVHKFDDGTGHTSMMVKFIDSSLRLFLAEKTGMDVFYEDPALLSITDAARVLHLLETFHKRIGGEPSLANAVAYFRNVAAKPLFDKLDAMVAKKVIAFELLPYFFKEGDKVVFFDDDQQIRGGIVKTTEMVSSWMGNYLLASVSVIDSNNHGFTETEAESKVYEFTHVMNHVDLPMRHATPDDIALLEKRGKFFQQIARKATYMNYHGNMLYKTSWFYTPYRADGRVMIDAASFAKLNPNDAHDGRRDKKNTNANISKNFLFTAPAYINGFSLATKKWGKFALDNLNDIDFREDAFDLLVLDQKVKTQIRALVEHSHGMFEDIISGKGGGCIFLLHGRPGGGKTLTAESVAELLKRPLYSVSVGELGTNPETLEANLRTILELSTIWNAVLLLDEADIFLESRTKHDVNRNAMVGVFLRLLEYHNGVLFLTTNRVSEFDEAFLSRISVGIKYPDHTESNREVIWRNLLKAAGVKDIDPKKLAHYEMNGRQIKNTVRIALALARAKSQSINMSFVNEVARQTIGFVDTVHKEQSDKAEEGMPIH